MIERELNLSFIMKFLGMMGIQELFQDLKEIEPSFSNRMGINWLG